MASADDEFRRAVADVAPLARRQHAVRKRPPAPPVPRQRLRDEAAALAESLAGPPRGEDALDWGGEPHYLRAGMPRQTLRRLRRGTWVVEAGLDLHGMNRAQATAAVAGFLQRCAARGQRCVRIVHGKGLGVLRAKLRTWLPRRDEVLAYCQAPAHDGGSGALLVLLKAKR
ncbi:MAG: Smr/MutS family protein [Burkholderiales bacterium]|nr:Smr/MutS family protein [Burkholderiales bacterium]